MNPFPNVVPWMCFYKCVSNLIFSLLKRFWFSETLVSFVLVFLLIYKITFDTVHASVNATVHTMQYEELILLVEDDSLMVSFNGPNVNICCLLLLADVGELFNLFFSFHMQFNLINTLYSYWKLFLTKSTENIMWVTIKLLKPSFKSLITGPSFLQFSFVFYRNILIILLTRQEKKELLT